MKIRPFLAALFGKGPGTPQGGPVVVSGAKVEAKRLPGGRPFGPVFGFFGDPVSRSILGHLSHETPEVCGGLGEPPGSLNLRGSATNLTRQRSPSRGAANPVGFAQTAAALTLTPRTPNPRKLLI